MTSDTILVQVLSTGHVDVWQVESVNLGGTGEIGVVRMHSLCLNNTIDSCPVEIAVPCNMVDRLIEMGQLYVYEKVSYAGSR